MYFAVKFPIYLISYNYILCSRFRWI